MRTTALFSSCGSNAFGRLLAPSNPSSPETRAQTGPAPEHKTVVIELGPPAANAVPLSGLADLADGGSNRGLQGSHRSIRGTAVERVDDSEEADMVMVDNDFHTYIPTRPPSVTRMPHSSTRTLSESVKEPTINKASLAEPKAMRWWSYTRGLHSNYGNKSLLARSWANTKFFFNQCFVDAAKEKMYQEEHWQVQKMITAIASLILFLAWLLSVILRPRGSNHVFDLYIATYGIGSLSVLLPILALFDAPRKFGFIWQITVMATSWTWSIGTLSEMYSCGFYAAVKNCGSRDFMGLMLYATAFPCIALFGLQQRRLPFAVGAASFIILTFIFVLPNRISWIRNITTYTIFQAFLAFSHFIRERIERRSFLVHGELKDQCQATIQAQEKERIAADSKRRFVSYIFHEVRVPLNQALLAKQNLEGEGVFSHVVDDQRDMVDALQNSLAMMAQVLNDVLDFNRMEEGQFACVIRPFHFHSVVRAISISLRYHASDRGLTLSDDLDPLIDRIGEDCGLGDGGYVLGDEMRLRQILNNLTSNACKFTQSGGNVRLVTKLVKVIEANERVASPTPNAASVGPDSGSIRRIDRSASPSLRSVASQRTVVIRMEIHDTGVGIAKSDLVTQRLFSPYVQTEAGRRQGGKGTGLGLALVRQIVELSRGRLGVKTKKGRGSTFWVELSFGVATLADMGSLDLSQVNAMSNNRRSSVEGMTSKGHLTRITEESNIGNVAPAERQSRGENIIEPFVQNIQAMRKGSNNNSRTPSVISRTTTASPANSLRKSLTSMPASLSVLVVDDDTITRLLMTRLLTRLGHTVTTAEDGAFALSKLLPEPTAEPVDTFDIIFLDNQMPRMSGVELVRELRNLKLNTYVCGVTGNALKEDQDEFLNAGANKVLTKPVMEMSMKEALECAKLHSKKGLSSGITDPDTSYQET